MERILTEQELKLPHDQQEWLRKRPYLIDLNKDSWIPIEQHLYLTAFGARTIKDAMEMEVLSNAYHAKQERMRRLENLRPPMTDRYSAAEDRLIDDEGCGLFGG